MTPADGLGPNTEGSLGQRIRRSGAYRSRRFVRRLREGREAPRSERDYATHVPVLAGMASRFRIERVLELGAGEYSTSVFLDRQVFPALSQLDSVETDAAWAEAVHKSAEGDPRLSLHVTSQAVSELIPSLTLGDYDLILVDDSATMDQRAASIAIVAATVPSGPYVVIHDYEVEEYRSASDALEHRVLCRRFTPQTVIGWAGGSDRLDQVEALRDAIEQAPGSPDPSDARTWARILAPRVDR